MREQRSRPGMGGLVGVAVFLHLIIGASLVLSLAGCSRQSSRAVQRLAVLRFENLTADPALDWMGRAFAEVLSSAVAGSPAVYSISPSALHQLDRLLGSRPARAPGISSERALALAAGANRLVYGQFAIVNGKLRADAFVEDVDQKRLVQTLSAMGSPENGLIPLAESLARQLSPNFRPFGTRSTPALQSHIAALESGDSVQAGARLEDALREDPDFGQAYVARVQLAIAEKDFATAERFLAQALARGTKIAEPERLRLAVEQAGLKGDAALREQALQALLRAFPADPVIYRGLAEIALNRREHDKAAGHLRAAAAIRPDDPAVLNLLGYTEAYRGDLRAAVNVLRHYERLFPREANPLDSLGDVHFYLGRFSEAEQFYLKAQEKNPAFLNGGALLKAAHARLMTGDLKGADAEFEKYLEALRRFSDPAIEYRKAEWWWLTGRRRQAAVTLAAFARAAEEGALRPVSARAYAHLALWNLEIGMREAARQLSAKAMELNPDQPGVAAVVHFLAGAEANRAVQADRLFPRASATLLKDHAEAYALLFSKQFERAVPVLRRIYRNSAQTSAPGIPVLLAWAYIESGRYQDAGPLLRANPVPEASGLALFTSLYFPRILYLRGRMLEQSGKQEEAKQYYRFFLTLSGDQALQFGEEQRAQQMLRRT